MNKQPTDMSETGDEPILDPKVLYTEEGVDGSLIDVMLALTPAQRLEKLQRGARSLLRILHANERL
jgi:hypothetical protein